MNENAKKWVKALRSGEYMQLRGRLSDGESYCCLGVACEVAIREGVPLRVERREIGTEVVVQYDNSGSTLPDVMLDWLGLCHPAGDYCTYDKGAGCLSSDNDHGATFEQIADIIESEPDGLFTPTC